MNGEIPEWQQPLSGEKIDWLVEQFALAKERIDRIWGPRSPSPWQANRR